MSAAEDFSTLPPNVSAEPYQIGRGRRRALRAAFPLAVSEIENEVADPSNKPPTQAQLDAARTALEKAFKSKGFALETGRSFNVSGSENSPNVHGWFENFQTCAVPVAAKKHVLNVLIEALNNQSRTHRMLPVAAHARSDASDRAMDYRIV